MSFLLDTDICSAYLKGEHAVWQRVMQYSGQLHVSAISVAELFTWALRANAPAKRLQGLDDLIRDVTCLEVDHDVSRKFGEIRAAQLDQGKQTPQLDLLVGATAVLYDLTLVTHNSQDFSEISGLKMADWLVP